MREDHEARAAEQQGVVAGPPDAEVVRRVRAGDGALFELLMRRHNRRVYRAIRSILRGEADVEDAMQEAYVSAFEHLAQFNGQSSFSTWLTRIAVNTALMRVRSGRRRLTLVTSDSPEEETMPDPIEVPEPERQAASRETAAILEHALDAIPELYRTVFVLREVEQLDTSETAAVLGVGDDVVKTRLHRARTALREQLLTMVGGTAKDAFDFQAPRCDRVVRAVLARILPVG
jgi:RNA polymerase sigma-70 factor (ECF subfamily)